MRRLATLSLLLLACVELPEFARQSLVDRPRVLTIVAEPPEARPGEPVDISLLLAGAESVQVTWRACGAFDSFVGGGAQYGDAAEEHCGSERGEALGEGETTVLPGELTERLFDDLELAATILGSALPAGIVRQVRDQVGLPFLVEARIIADGKLIRAVKRVLISERERPHVNPPLPHFTLAQSELHGDPEARFKCRPVAGETPRLPLDREVDLIPVTEGESESWLEQYPVLTARGELAQRTERAFYSWFSSGGRFQENTTRSPLRNQRWRTPSTPGCYPLWLVIRDGHGGTSACGLQIAIGEADCDDR